MLAALLCDQLLPICKWRCQLLIFHTVPPACISEDTLKRGRLYKAFLWWFSEKRKKGISFSYRFTGLESKYFCWQFATFIQELLKIPTLSKGHVQKLHTLSFIGVKLSDAVSICDPPQDFRDKGERTGTAK